MIKEAQILLDCDGVLANFVKASFVAHNKEYSDDLDIGWDYFEDWNISEKQFWDKLRGYDFWYNIEPYPWAKTLYNSLKSIAPVNILTAPSEDSECPQAKIEWLRDHLGVPLKEIIISRNKYLFANKTNILIDDNMHKIESFYDYGGNVIVFPQSWNKNHRFYPHSDYRSVIKQCSKMVEGINHYICNIK